MSPEGRYWMDHTGQPVDSTKPLHYQFGNQYWFPRIDKYEVGYNLAINHGRIHLDFLPQVLLQGCTRKESTHHHIHQQFGDSQVIQTVMILYNRTNHIVLLEITGCNWWNTWTPFTISAIIWYIFWESNWWLSEQCWILLASFWKIVIKR